MPLLVLMSINIERQFSIIFSCTDDKLLSPPVLLKSPETVFVERFADAAFKCDVIGNPEPLITWYKDGMEIIGATQRTLVVTEVDLSARAAYYCTALNSQGNVTSEEAYLNIRGYYINNLHVASCQRGFSCHIFSGLAQYSFSVTTNKENVSTVDKWV